MPSNQPPDRVYRFGEFRLRADDRMLLRGEERISMAPRVFELLLALVENPGRLVSKESLMNRIWEDSFVEEGNLNQTVSRLRKILGERPNDNRFIETVPRVGYRFIADVELIDGEDRSRQVAPPAGEEVPAGGVAVERVVPARSAGRRWRFIALPLALVTVGVVAAMWFLLPRTPATGERPPKQTPLRLTVNPTREDGPAFTREGNIRFMRWVGDQAYAHIMAGNGSDQRRDTSIPNLRTGLWSPDGRKVVFHKDGDPSGTLYLADADGANEITLPFVAGNMNWSQDGSKIVYQAGKPNSDIYLYMLETGENTTLIAAPGFESDPSFSPDGKSVAFVSDRDGNTEIYIQDLDGSNLRRLTDHPAHDEFPTFSPDGTQIVFNSNREGENFDVYLMNTDGSGLRRLTNWRSDEEIRPGCWSVDGTQIVLMSNREGKSNVYKMEVEPFAPKLVLATADRDLFWPNYSPDGAKLLFVSEGADKTGQLHVLDVATGRDDVLLELEDAEAYPKFSPDGSLILLQKRINGNAEICIMNPEGSELRNLTNNPARDAFPSWSPDGNRIAFVSNREGNYDVFSIYMMNADGSNPHRIYYTYAISNFPVWSPDGRTLIFGNDKEDGRTGNFEIFAIEPETVQQERRLTFRPTVDTHPAFSPDGKRIAFTSFINNNYEIYVMNADGSVPIRVTRDAGHDLSPGWAPDGKKLLFASDRSGKYALYEVLLD